jgi:type IV secretory pathway VirB10-like protein
MKRFAGIINSMLIFIFIIIIPALILAQDQGDDYIDGDTVQKHDTGDMLDSGTVTKVEKPTAVPTAVPQQPEPTEAPTAVPTRIPPTPAPTHRPEPRSKATHESRPERKVKSRKPAPTPAPTQIVKPADFAVIQATADELAKQRSASNYFGLFDHDRKFKLSFTVQNTGEAACLNTVAVMKSGNAEIIIANPEEDLQTVLPAGKREISYDMLILSGYDGGAKLPLSLNIKGSGFDRDYPLDITVAAQSDYSLYYIGGGILLLIILLIIILTRRRGRPNKEDDFEIK